jgi:MFS family permease
MPILILFFLDFGLSYKEIFWIFTIGSVFSFLIEIPTGIFADFYGKRRSIILSKFLIFVSFLVFGFSSSFWMFVLAQVVYELGIAFRSGTETAYVYDFLDSNRNKTKITYTEVKGKQKFYARISESLSAFVGGFLVVYFGFSFIFFIAAIPAFLNFVFTLFWEDLKEKKKKISFSKSLIFIRGSFGEILKKVSVLKLVLNIALFSGVIVALDKFIQPYMIDAGIKIEYVGVIYAVFLFLGAIIVRYSYLFENKFGQIKTINYLTLFAVIPALILGFGYISIIGVFLFFLIVIIENIRSPIANSLFHSYVDSENRATMGSILELFKSVVKLILLPIVGYVADIFSIYQSILMLSIVLFFNGILFYVLKKN